MHLLLTVPHGFCPIPFRRECDLRALSVAKMIGKIYTQMSGEKSDLVYIPKKRAIVDLNRKRPPFWNEEGIEIWEAFNERIMSKLKEETLLLDIHSFPIGSFEDAQIAILELTHEDRAELLEFVNLVRKKTGINVKIFKGKGNYIQDYYREKSYPLLLEFCEDKDYLSDEEIKQFMWLLLDFFK